MKYLLIITLSLVSVAVYAGHPKPEPTPQPNEINNKLWSAQNVESNNSNTNITGSASKANSKSQSRSFSQSGSSSNSKSNSTAESGDSISESSSVLSNSGNVDVGDVGNTRSDIDSINQLSIQYEASASSAASIDLAYCSDGGSGQGLKIGLSSGQVNFICESIMVIRANLSVAQAELLAAKECHDSNDKNIRKLYQGHIDRAHKAFRDNVKINDRINKYISRRAKTASIGAQTRDLSIPLIILVALIAL